jgi:hypothetical protein
VSFPPIFRRMIMATSPCWLVAPHNGKAGQRVERA